MHQILEPNLRELLLPLLSCLPVAFVSSRPPPSLLPLLSPILRQRVHLRSVNAVASPHDSSSSSANWLSLLTWSPAHARRLTEICSTLQLEAHPVSGELELFSDEADEAAGRTRYKRLDVETLQARSDVQEHSLRVVWVWCENDDGAVGLPGTEGVASSAQDGWRVADIQPLEEREASISSDESWQSSISLAEERYARFEGPREPTAGSQRTEGNSNGNSRTMTPGASSTVSNDDDYWASYDRTPNQTPEPKGSGPTNARFAQSVPASGNRYDPSIDRKPSVTDDYWGRYDHSPDPAPSRNVANPGSRVHGAANVSSQTRASVPDPEADYYARYGSVQPALDAHDPDEQEGASTFESTLRHDSRGRSVLHNPPAYSPPNHDEDNRQPNNEPATIASSTTGPLRIHSPTPSRPSTSSSGRSASVEALEASASALDGPADHAPSAAEIGVKQHISTELKSLFRLARAAGIERSEFERVVKTELDVLDLMDI